MNDAIEIMKHYSPLVSVLTFFLGLFVGNKQAIGRDRRKEFNELSEPLLAYYEQLAYEAYRKAPFSSASLPSENINKIRRRLPVRQQSRYAKLIEEVAKLRPRWEAKTLDEIYTKSREMCELLKLR